MTITPTCFRTLDYPFHQLICYAFASILQELTGTKTHTDYVYSGLMLPWFYPANYFIPPLKPS